MMLRGCFVTAGLGDLVKVDVIMNSVKDQEVHTWL